MARLVEQETIFHAGEFTGLLRQSFDFRHSDIRTLARKLDALTKGASDAGIEVTANMTRKIVVLKVGNTPRPTIKHEISRSQPQQENGRPVDDESRLAVVSK